MTHLGERISALVDGQLPAEATERALMHVAGCPACREAVELERLTKQRLAALAPPPPGEQLLGRLLELAGPAGPLPPRPGHVPGSPRPELVTGLAGAARQRGPWAQEPSRGAAQRPPGRRDRSRPEISRRSRTRVAAAMVGAACLVGAGVAGGVASGATAGGRQVVPPVDSFVLEHKATTGGLPFGDQPVMWGVVEAGR